MYACCRPVLCVDHVPASEATSSLAYSSPPCSYPSPSVTERPSQSSVRPLAWYVPQSSHYMCPYLVFAQFAASIPPLMYSLLGTSRQLNVAPEAALSLLVGQAVTEFRRLYPELDPDYVGAAVATAIGLQVRPHYLKYHRKSQQAHRSGFLHRFLAFWTLFSAVLYYEVLLPQSRLSLQCAWRHHHLYISPHTPPASNSSPCLDSLVWKTNFSLKQLWTRLFFSYKTYGHMHINSPPSSALVLCWY